MGPDTMQNISEKALKILYLIASSPLITSNEVQQVSSYLFKDPKLANHLCKKLNDVKCTFSTALNMAKRYPVVLVIDEVCASVSTSDFIKFTITLILLTRFSLAGT